MMQESLLTIQFSVFLSNFSRVYSKTKNLDTNRRSYKHFQLTKFYFPASFHDILYPNISVSDKARIVF